MLTSVGKVCSSVILSSQLALPIYSSSASDVVHNLAKDKDGNNIFVNLTPYNTAFDLISSPSTSGNTGGVIVGSGNTPPTENDYWLESPISGLTAQAATPSKVYDEVNKKYISRLEYAISNATGADVTIKEVGLCRVFNYSTTEGASPGNNRTRVLVDRTVLTEPLVIPNGESSTLRYDFIYG